MNADSFESAEEAIYMALTQASMTRQEALSVMASFKHHKAVDPRRLYDWLGRKAEQGFLEADERSAGLDGSVGPVYAAEAMCEVRAHMRRIDPGLPVEAIDP